MNLEHPLVRMMMRKCVVLKFDNKDIIFYWVPSHTGIGGNEKADFATKSALVMQQSVCPVQIFKHVSTSIFFPLRKVTGMVRLRTSFILSSQPWDIGSPLTGGAGRKKISCVVPASVILI